MKTMKLSLLLALGLAATAAKNTGSIVLSDVYEDCVLLESLFDCTDCDDLDIEYPYDTTPGVGSTQDYELVTCNFPGQCPDGTVKNTCSW
jgi:hypothetical protein